MLQRLRRLGSRSTARLWLGSLLVLACVPVRAEIHIEINGIEAEMRRNVLVFLSLQRYRERAGLDADTLERLEGRAEREVKSALRPFGYYEPTVHTELTAARGGRDWRVVIDVDPGKPVVVGEVDVKVSGPGATDPLFVRLLKNVRIRPGERLSHAAYDDTKSALQRTAATYGYLDAKLMRSELLVDPPNHAASVHLELDTGLRYHFGPTRIDQKVVSDALVRRYLRYRQGEPYDANELLRTQFALDDSQYFSTLEVLPDERDPQSLAVPVNIHGEAARRNRYQFGVGYGTDTLARGTLAWDDRRINDEGHRSHVELQYSAVQYILDARYIIPIGDPALEKLTLEATGQKTVQTGDLDYSQFTFQPSVTQVLGSWQRVFFAILTNERTNSGSSTNTDTLLIPGISYASVPRGFLGEDLFTRGFYADLRGSEHFLGANSNFLQLRLQAERAFDLSPLWHLLLRGNLGASLVSNFGQLPGSQRFFAGGDRSVRGYAFNDLSPVTEDPVTHLPVKVGGRDLLSGTFELERDLPRSFGVAFFADAGNAFNSFGDHLKYSVGIGVRFRLPVVTVGIDIAQPLVGEDCLNTSVSTDPTCHNGVRPRAGPRLHLNFSPKI